MKVAARVLADPASAAHRSRLPRIKCNISRGGERIYHLPFDQQYDTTVITPNTGELWAQTVAEAETAGFRRAWRWLAARAR